MAGYKVIVSERADMMMVRHARFLAKVSKNAALRLADEFESVLNELEENPYQFPTETDENLPGGMYRKALFCKWYKAIFTIEGQNVYLDAVLDCRQDNQGYLPL